MEEIFGWLVGATSYRRHYRNVESEWTDSLSTYLFNERYRLIIAISIGIKGSGVLKGKTTEIVSNEI